MVQGLLWSLVVALCFAGAPLIMRTVQLGPWMMGILVTVGSLVAVSPFIPFQNYIAMGGKSLTIGILAGVVNGIGLLAFYQIVAGSMKGLWGLSSVAPIAYALVPVFIGIGAYMFFGDKINTNQAIGIGLVAFGIWFLGK